MKYRTALIVVTLFAALQLPAACQPLPTVEQLTKDFNAALQKRHLETKFSEMTAFFGDRLDASAGEKTFSDKTGNCRLAWYDWMMRHPAESVNAADEFTRGLHTAAAKSDGSLTNVTGIAAAKLDADLPTKPGAVPIIKFKGDKRLQPVVNAIAQARQALLAATQPLTSAEREELTAKLFAQSTGPQARAPFFGRREGRRVCDLLEKMDRRALMQAGAALSTLSDANTLKSLAGRRQAQQSVDTPAGRIIVGSSGKDEYRLDEMANVCAVIDSGGDDSYIEGSVSPARPVLIIIDLAGNDTYRGQQPGVQGGAILGVSLLIDAAGDDNYTAGDIAQGASLGGIGILEDRAGNDRYLADKRVQGQGLCGLGVLIDRAGNDDYRAALYGQGVGAPLGFGLLDDLAGDDHYYAGGKYPDPYDDSPGYSGWSQGMGVGPRGSANGGIGVLLDGGGNDIYECDYFSHGGAYWFALGFARDFGGNDQRVGSTRTAWDGSERKEARFLRYGIGFGCHYAAGYLFDDAGDDLYFADHGGVAFTWDVSLSALVDQAGKDRYEAGSGVATCYNSGLALLFDGLGDDSYASGNTGIAAAKSDYHEVEPRSHNFTLLLDLQGKDTYPQEIANASETERGWAGGMVIDR